MEILIVETANTEKGASIDTIMSKHAICRSDADKKKYLPLFTQPTCTKNTALMAIAKRCEEILT